MKFEIVAVSDYPKVLQGINFSTVRANQARAGTIRYA